MQEKKYSRKHIGKVYTTHQGYTATVVDGGSKQGRCTAQIGEYTTEVLYTDLKRGQIKYPYHPSVFNKGYFGVGAYSVKTHKKAYKTWQSMLGRCYDSSYLEKNQTYKSATVCDEWLNLQVFGKWFEQNYVEGFELDKDLLKEGSKLYSPDTCIFIPKNLNSFLANKMSNNTSGHTGVTWHTHNKKWVARILTEDKRKLLGYFTNIEEASEAYKKARKEEVVRLQELYRDVLPSNVLIKIA